MQVGLLVESQVLHSEWTVLLTEHHGSGVMFSFLSFGRAIDKVGLEIWSLLFFLFVLCVLENLERLVYVLRVEFLLEVLANDLASIPIGVAELETVLVLVECRIVYLFWFFAVVGASLNRITFMGRFLSETVVNEHALGIE